MHDSILSFLHFTAFHFLTDSCISFEREYNWQPIHLNNVSKAVIFYRNRMVTPLKPSDQKNAKPG